MKRFKWLILFLILPWLISGCGKGKEATIHEEHQEEVKKAEDLNMKSLTMESIQKEGKVKEVLINLAQNAIQATPPGGTVTLKVLRNSGGVKIQISDTGKGIPHENLDKVFIPFFTTKPEGNGIGLAVSKEIVEAHGGTIKVDSKEGIGTQFTIVLPITN